MIPTSLLTELRSLGMRVERIGDQLNCRSPRGVLTPEHAKHLRALKPGILALLDAEEYEITWRVNYMLASDPPIFSLLNLEPIAGQCWSCEEPQPYGQDGKCTLCCLAAFQVDRIVRGIEPTPAVDKPVRSERPRLPSWDCPCSANVAGDWTWCPVCQKPKSERDMYISQPALLEVGS